MPWARPIQRIKCSFTIKGDNFDKDDKHSNRSQIKEHLMQDEVNSPHVVTHNLMTTPQ